MLFCLRRLYECLGLIFCCCLFFYFVGSYAYTTNLELDAVEYYHLFPICLGVFLVMVTGNVFLFSYDFDDIKVLFILLISLLCVGYLLDCRLFTLGNEHAYNVFCVGIASYVFVFHVSRNQLPVFLLFVNVLTFVVIAKAYSQIFTDHGTLSRSLAVTGYFDNSGMLAAYLVVTFPLLIHIFVGGVGRIMGKKWLYIAYVFLTSLFAGLLVVTLSRTSLLCFFVINAVVLWIWFRKRITAFIRAYRLYFWLIVVAAGFVAIIGFKYLYHLKFQSAEGRMLIWKICMENIPDRPLFGTGLGTFGAYYPIWQSDYFEQNVAPTSYFLSAGETVNAFNEYIQLFCECGAAGLLFFIFSVTATFLAEGSHLGRRLTSSFKLSMAAIIFISCTFYALHCTSILFLAFILPLKLLYDPERCETTFFNQQMRVPVYVLVMALISLTIFRGTERSIAIRDFEKVYSKHDLSNQQLRAVEDNIYPVLQTDGKFLTRLGLMMWDYGRGEKAAGYLQESLNFYSGYETRYQLAKCYLGRKEYEKALEQFRFLSFYVPSKFAPKYERFKIYRSLGFRSDAAYIARLMLNMPVKMASPAVDEIKKDIYLYLQEGR